MQLTVNQFITLFEQSDLQCSNILLATIEITTAFNKKEEPKSLGLFWAYLSNITLKYYKSRNLNRP